MLDMKKIDEETVWVDYVVGKKKTGEKYRVKFITDERVRMEYAREKKKDESDRDETGAELTIALAVLACQDWEGITSGGLKFECTEANKKILFSKFFNRAEFVVRSAKNESLFLGAKLEEDLKN